MDFKIIMVISFEKIEVKMENFTRVWIYTKYVCEVLWKVLTFTQLESKKEKPEWKGQNQYL